MYPHQKLEWSQQRLEARLAEAPEDLDARLELCRALLSRGLYHGGGEQVCALALQHARRALVDDPAHVEAQVLAGAALVGMDRPEAAQPFLAEALRMAPERADLHLALGAMHRGLGDRHLAIRHLEIACRADPSAWEVHLLLGRTLAERAKQVGGQRLVERSQYHLVQALRKEPSPDLLAPLMRDLGLSCLQTGRYADAEKLFVRLRENEKYATVARRYLGQVAFALGKYKGAIQHSRQFLELSAAEGHAEDPTVLAQVGMAYLQLRELERAREFCHRALLFDPHLLSARHALGCTLVEEGQLAEALKLFRDTLEDHPEDMASYVELARARRHAGDVAWLKRALDVEAGGYDRLPFTGGPDAPRTITRKRIAVLLEELRAVGPSSVATVLAPIELTEDEGLRFQLWEAACLLAAGHVADEVSARLRDPGKNFGVALARNAICAAAFLPEPTLTAGLAVTAADIERAAVERHGQASDLAQHRRHLDAERAEARAFQAILLLAIATRRSRAARQLLQSWGKDVDAELEVAVLAAQAMLGDAAAARALARRGQERGAGPMVERLLAVVSPATAPGEPHELEPGSDTHCSACGRTGKETAHLVTGTRAVVCDQCFADVARDRRALAAPDDAACQLCGRMAIDLRGSADARGVYRVHRVDVCGACLDLSLGLLERREVELFLASW